MEEGDGALTGGEIYNQVERAHSDTLSTSPYIGTNLGIMSGGSQDCHQYNQHLNSASLNIPCMILTMFKTTLEGLL